MGSTKDPEDGKGVARVCYLAALAYLALGTFCGFQVSSTEIYPEEII